jgi:hypothetical protein
MKLVVAVIVALMLGSTTASAQSSSAADTLLQRLETAKWRPSVLGPRKALHDLFAPDFMTVEYDPNGAFAGVHRKVNARRLLDTGGEDALIKALNAMTFTLSDWRFQHLSPTVVLVSYQVASPEFGDTSLWATSIWRRAGDKWQTAFYQASTARK